MTESRCKGEMSGRKSGLWSSRRAEVVMNLSRNHEVAGLIPGLAQWIKDPALL